MRCTKAVFMTVCLALSLEARVQAGYIYTTLPPPNSSTQEAHGYGINDKGDIVGSYISTSGLPSLNGFVLSNGVYTTIDNGPLLATFLTGINNAGSMAGYFVVPIPDHILVLGFKVIGGTTTAVFVPGADATMAFGINSLGQIVGNYYESNGGHHGFLLNGSTYTRIDDPSAGVGGATNVFGINDKGDIVGTYDSKNGQQSGFLLSGGKYTTISFPDSVSTTVTGINQSGQIVGDYEQPAGIDHGFLYNDGRYTTLDVPGSNSTDLYGINAQGEIVGTYLDARGVFHAFTATAVPEPGSVTLLAGGLGIMFAATSHARGRWPSLRLDTA
jgi:probable HAF family extracellular repeat protein